MTIQQDVVAKVVKIAWCRPIARGKTRDDRVIYEFTSGWDLPKPKLVNHQNVVGRLSRFESF